MSENINHERLLELNKLIEPLTLRSAEIKKEMKEIESLFPQAKNKPLERYKLQEQMGLLIAELTNIKNDLSAFSKERSEFQNYPKLKAFVTAAKRRMSVEDFYAAWAEVDEMVLLGNL